jgi:hypothetical protein
MQTEYDVQHALCAEVVGEIDLTMHRGRGDLPQRDLGHRVGYLAVQVHPHPQHPIHPQTTRGAMT